jgi:hypothetical protein
VQLDGETGRVYLDAAQLTELMRDKASRYAVLAAGNDPGPQAVAQQAVANLLGAIADDIEVGCLDYLMQKV